mmetsp:Transcript_37088/g.86241  ORF Transcript_37088/g.86241 Transcript_37088/m.86241 type:complete len:192 (+) Transcript_37088:379-954(+)
MRRLRPTPGDGDPQRTLLEISQLFGAVGASAGDDIAAFLQDSVVPTYNASFPTTIEKLCSDLEVGGQDLSQLAATPHRPTTQPVALVPTPPNLCDDSLLAIRDPPRRARGRRESAAFRQVSVRLPPAPPTNGKRGSTGTTVLSASLGRTLRFRAHQLHSALPPPPQPTPPRPPRPTVVPETPLRPKRQRTT